MGYFLDLFKKDSIFESLDSPVKYTVKEFELAGRVFKSGTFTINKKNFNFIIEIIELKRMGFAFSRTSNSGESMGDLNDLSTKEVLSVFSTIHSIIEYFAENNQIDIIEFSSTTLDKVTLYTKLAKKLAFEKWIIYHKDYLDFCLVRKASEIEISANIFKQKYIKIKNKKLNESTELSIMF